MKEWIQIRFTHELLENPVWLLSTFGHLKEGDQLSSSSSEIQELLNMIVNLVKIVPLEIYDRDYSHTWHVSDFIPSVKQALRQITSR